jgi:phosphoglycolate phosphatase
MHKPSAVLFDLDGTLLDSALDFHFVINQMLAQENKPPINVSQLRQQVSNGARAMVSFAFKINPQSEEFEQYKSRFLDNYLTYINKKSSLYPGVIELLSYLEHKHIQWAIVTNKPALYTRPILDYFELSDRVSATICPDHVTVAKPDPQGLLLACRKMAVAAQHCWYVGDHLRDIQAGLAAGMFTVGCNYGYLNPDENSKNWGADLLIDSPMQLINAIESDSKQHSHKSGDH